MILRTDTQHGNLEQSYHPVWKLSTQDIYAERMLSTSGNMYKRKIFAIMIIFEISCVIFIVLRSKTQNPQASKWTSTRSGDLYSYDFNVTTSSDDVALLTVEIDPESLPLNSVLKANFKVECKESMSAKCVYTSITPENCTNGLIQVEVITTVNQTQITKPTQMETKIRMPDLDEPNLKKILLNYDKGFKNLFISKHNTEGVRYGGKKFHGLVTRQVVSCRLQKGIPSMLGNDSSPFKEMGITRYFPSHNLYDKYQYKQCAVVLSSFTLNGTGLGDEIDSHEAVLRLNNAPTVGFEKDVGKKTTIRLMNSKTFDIYKSRNDSDELFDVSTLVLWKTGLYNGNLYKWYLRPTTKEFIAKYISWRIAYPSLDSYLIHPRSLWFAWDAVEYFNKGKPLKTIVPSTGFTGMLMMLGMCDTVKIFGFQYTDKSSCHYYDKPTCNKNSIRWHPLQEKSLILAMNQGSKNDLDRGIVTITGAKNMNCL